MGRVATRIISPTDRQLVGIFRGIARKVAPEQASYSFHIGDNDPIAISGNYASESSADQSVEVLEKSNGALISHATLNLPDSISVTVQRQEAFSNLIVNYPRHGTADRHLGTIAVVKKAFAKVEAVGAVQGILGPELEEFYRRREEALLRLEDLSDSIIVRTEEYRQELDRQASSARAALHEEFKQKAEALSSEHATRMAHIDQREQELDARTKELDDRSSRHVRRDLRNQLKQMLQDRNTKFTLTQDTQRKRIPVHAIFILLLGVVGVYAVSVVRDALIGPAPLTWEGVARTVFALTSFGATAAFYIRWNDHWARRHAEEEFRLRQLELDVDRASWLVEMALEWRDDKGAEIPPALVDRLTRGLFERESKLESPRHPTEELASALIGASSGLTVNVPGVGELRLDRSGIRRFAKAVDDSQSRSGDG